MPHIDPLSPLSFATFVTHRATLRDLGAQDGGTRSEGMSSSFDHGRYPEREDAQCDFAAQARLAANTHLDESRVWLFR